MKKLERKVRSYSTIKFISKCFMNNKEEIIILPYWQIRKWIYPNDTFLEKINEYFETPREKLIIISKKNLNLILKMFNIKKDLHFDLTEFEKYPDKEYIFKLIKEEDDSYWNDLWGFHNLVEELKLSKIKVFKELIFGIWNKHTDYRHTQIFANNKQSLISIKLNNLYYRYKSSKINRFFSNIRFRIYYKFHKGELFKYLENGL